MYLCNQHTSQMKKLRFFLLKVKKRWTIINNKITRRAPMWQQSGTLQFCSCHGIAGFLVHELEI